MPKGDDDQTSSGRRLQRAVAKVQKSFDESGITKGSKDPLVHLLEHTRLLTGTADMDDKPLCNMLNLQTILYEYAHGLPSEHCASFTEKHAEQNSKNQCSALANMINGFDFLPLKFNGTMESDTPDEERGEQKMDSPSASPKIEFINEDKDDAVEKRRTSAEFNKTAMGLHAKQRKDDKLKKARQSYMNEAALSQNEQGADKSTDEYQIWVKPRWKALLTNFKLSKSKDARDRINGEIFDFLIENKARISSNYHNSSYEDQDLSKMILGIVDTPKSMPKLKSIKIGLVLSAEDEDTDEMNIITIIRIVQKNIEIVVDYAWALSKKYITENVFKKPGILEKREVTCLWTALSSIGNDLQLISEKVQLGFDTSFDNVVHLGSDGKILSLNTQYQNFVNRRNDILHLAKVNAGLNAWTNDERITQLKDMLSAEAQSKFIELNKNSPNIKEITTAYKKYQSEQADLPTGANDLKPFYVKPFIPDELMNELCMTCKLTEQQSKDFTKVYKSNKQEHFKANYGSWKPSGEQKTDNSNKNKVSLTETMIVTAASEALKTFEIRTKVELDDDKSEMSRFSLLELLETKVTKAEAQNAIKYFMFQVVNKINSKNKGLIKKGNQRSQNYTRRKGGGGRGGSRKNGGRD